MAANDLAAELTNVSKSLAAQGIASSVDVFDGESTKFRSWTKSVEKYAVLVGADPGTKILIAYQSARGLASDFIERFRRRRPAGTWEELKEQLEEQFGEMIDRQHAFTLLRRAKQLPKETVQVFAQRLLSLAEDSFGQGIENEVAQQQIVGFFIDGLLSTPLKEKLLREGPATFDRAVATATAEQNIRKRIGIRLGREENISRARPDRQIEPMEVDRSKPLRCFKCGGPHKAKYCDQPKQSVRAVATETKRRTREEVICWGCGLKGHILRECPKNGTNPLRRGEKGSVQSNGHPRGNLPYRW